MTLMLFYNVYPRVLRQKANFIHSLPSAPFRRTSLRFVQLHYVSLSSFISISFSGKALKITRHKQYSLNHFHYVHYFIRSFLTHYVVSLRFVNSFYTAVMAKLPGPQDQCFFSGAKVNYSQGKKIQCWRLVLNYNFNTLVLKTSLLKRYQSFGIFSVKTI
jgi:hypothetical protein